MKLEFTHPGTGDRVRFESRYPDDLQHALNVLREA
jgi:23S rRNA pseudouridine1911/1915/1917 synthase